MPSADVVRAAVRAAVAALSTRLAGEAMPAAAIVERSLGDELVVVVAVLPRGGRTRRLTPCERDVVDVLRRAVQRLTEPEIAAELLRRGIDYASVTTRRALAHLVRLGWCDSSRHAPRGYLLLAPPELTHPAE